jgi:hypothetical protein
MMSCRQECHKNEDEPVKIRTQHIIHEHLEGRYRIREPEHHDKEHRLLHVV